MIWKIDFESNFFKNIEFIIDLSDNHISNLAFFILDL